MKTVHRPGEVPVSKKTNATLGILSRELRSPTKREVVLDCDSGNETIETTGLDKRVVVVADVCETIGAEEEITTARTKREQWK